MSGAELAAAARALVGAPFLLDGREAATGLDCLGVLAAALAGIGHDASLPPRSSLLRRGDLDADRIARLAGLIRAKDGIVAGDVLLVRCAPLRPHVLVAVEPNRFVHAHAALRRVVLGARDPNWPIAGHWRLPEPD